jgi:hypothetical protein
MHMARLFEPESTQPNDQRISPQQLLEMWNAAAEKHKLRKGVALNPERTRRIVRLLKDWPWRSHWQLVIDKISESDFCRGLTEPGNGHARFVAGFDFLTRIETHLKVLEGLYDNRGGNRDQFRQNQRRAMIETLRGRSMTLITEDNADEY